MFAKPSIYNLALPLAATEYSQALPNNVKKFFIASRNTANLKIAFTANETATKFLTVKAGSSGLWIEAMLLYGETLYVQSDQAGDTAEILCFV